MRPKLSLVLYMLLVEVVGFYLVVFPVYAFQVSSSTTGYVRIASQAATQAMVAAQRSATLAAVAPLISGASAGSVAVRMIAGSVGWPVLGVTVGITLAMLYYDSTKAAAIKAAASPTTNTVPFFNSTQNGWITNLKGCTGVSSPYCDAMNASGYNGSYNQTMTSDATRGCPAAGPGWVYVGNTNAVATGYVCVYFHQVGSPGTLGSSTVSAPTSTQVQSYVASLPANDPNSVESNTVSVGAQATPTPADSMASNPVSSTDVATQVVPATQVQPTDLVVDPNATKPAGTVTNNSTTQTTTTTTTTTVNPDGSTTKQETDSAPVSCTSGNHEVRTFGGILQAHMDLWKGSGLLSALTLLKTLIWPTTIPTYSLQSNLLGNFTLDFSAWSGMLTAIRSIIIAIAGFVAYRMIFVGAR